MFQKQLLTLRVYFSTLLILRPIAQAICLRVVRCVIYLDNLIIFTDTFDESNNKARFTMNLLQGLGSVVNL